MATYGDSFTTSLPVVGASGPQYATDIDTIMTDIMTRLSSKVPLSSLLVTSDFSLSSFNLTNVSTVGLVNLAGTNAAGTAIPRIEAVNGDFYFVGPSGAVKITAGTSINAAGVAGITGDYGGANPAQFRYDSANTRYDAFANQGTGQWAYVRGLGFDIAAGTTSTVRARLLFGGGSNVSYTLPTAAPVAQALLQMDNTGQMTASNTLPSGTNITLQGTGHILRGSRTTTTPFHWLNGIIFTGATSANQSPGTAGAAMPSSCDLIFPISLPDADQHLSQVNSVVVNHSATGTGTVSFTLYTATGSVFTAVTGAAASTLSSPVTLTPTTPFTPAAGTTVWVRVTTASTNTTQAQNAQLNTTIIV